MALFKVCRGAEGNLPAGLNDGYAYFCTDTGSFYIDHKNTSNTLVRSKISAKYADKLRYIKDGETIEIDASEILTANNALDVIGTATTAQAGFMSSEDKEKLNGVPTDVTNYLSYAVTAHSVDGVIYTATVPSITSLVSGVSFIMIPDLVSASTSPTLNVNGLGAKSIRRRLSNISTATQIGYTATWLAANLPFRVVYDGTQWIVEGHNKPASVDLYGNVPITKGGTGADNAEDALTNLGIYIGDTEPTDDNVRVWINTAEEWSGTMLAQDRLVTVSMPASGWTGSTNPWSQTLTISGITASSKLDLNPTAHQIVALQNEEITLMISNEDGVAVAYAIGGKPSTDMHMQVLISEVVVIS